MNVRGDEDAACVDAHIQWTTKVLHAHAALCSHLRHAKFSQLIFIPIDVLGTVRYTEYYYKKLSGVLML